jgi:hypothetical protein
MFYYQEFRSRWGRFKSALEDLDVKEYDSGQKYSLLKSLNEFLNEILDCTERKPNKEEVDMTTKTVTAEDISQIFIKMEEKYGKDKAIGILVGTTQESTPLLNGKSATQILFEKLQEYQNKEEKEMTETPLAEDKKIKDKDLDVVKQYLFGLEKIYQEMKELEVKRLDTASLVLDVKLNRLYEFYKGMIPLGSLDNVRTFYLNKYTN